MSYCDRCLFAGSYRDMGASVRICSLIRDLTSSVNFRASNDGKDSCPYALFFCDLVVALSRSVGLPDRDIIFSNSYLWSFDVKRSGCNRDLHVSVNKG